MKKLLLFFTILLLLFNGSGALFGGWSLMTDSSGKALGLELAFLDHSPFNNYFIPGVVLFVCNGVFSFIVIAAIFFRSSYYSRLIAAQGVILAGWLIIQILLIQIIYYLHFVLGATAIGLIICGLLLDKIKRKEARR